MSADDAVVAAVEPRPTPEDEAPLPLPKPLRRDPRTVATVGLFVLALLYTLYFARGFLLPIAIAVLLNFLLSPAVRWLKKLRIPEALGAAIVILGLLGAVGVAGYGLAAPAQQWIAKGPASLQKAASRLRQIQRPVEQVTRTAAQVERATHSADEKPAPEVVVRGPTLGSRLLGMTQTLLAAALTIIMLLYFLLAAGDLFTLKIVKVLPQFGDKKKAVAIIKETEASISKYLGTVTLVNLSQGIAVMVAMFLVGMPNAPLWGALAAMAEFIPYLGALAMVIVLSLAGLATFDELGRALMVPGAFLVINLLQANVISPLILGRRLALNPVAIFIGLGFWLWVWGLPGAFLAVPIIASLKICCDHIDMLAPVGEFLTK